MLVNQIAPFTSPIKILLIVFFTTIVIFKSRGVSALMCYRGQQNASLSVSGHPQECPVGSMTCTKIYEPSMHIAQRDCSVTNCTVNITF